LAIVAIVVLTPSTAIPMSSSSSVEVVSALM
jgi:hypothetical protein